MGKAIVRHCSICGQTGHRSDHVKFHPKEPAGAAAALKSTKTVATKTPVAQRDPKPVDRDALMRVMIDPQYAVWLVTQRAVGAALSNASIASAEARHANLATNESMLVALATLEQRSRAVDPDFVEEVRSRRLALEEANALYLQAADDLLKRLGYQQRLGYQR